ncbi:hypothetical protein ACSBR1_002220 [Camellia fascicularis]
MPFSLSLNWPDGEAEEKEADVEEEVKADVATVAKSLTLNDKVLDLTEEDGDEVSKSNSPKKTNTSEAEITATAKSLDQTLLKIDTEIIAEKSAQLSVEAETTPITEAEQFEDHVDT